MNQGSSFGSSVRKLLRPSYSNKGCCRFEVAVASPTVDFRYGERAKSSRAAGGVSARAVAGTLAAGAAGLVAQDQSPEAETTPPTAQQAIEIQSGGIHQVKPGFERRLDSAPVLVFDGHVDFTLQGGSIAYFIDRKASEPDIRRSNRHDSACPKGFAIAVRGAPRRVLLEEGSLPIAASALVVDSASGTTRQGTGNGIE